MRSAETAHSVDLDNVQAGLDCLNRAVMLLVMQTNLAENTKGWVLAAQKSLATATSQKAVNSNGGK